jgi:hypothetical protein
MKKKKLPPAKSPLPKLKSDHDAADYFESHSVGKCVGSIGGDSSAQAVARAGEEDSRPPRPGEVSDLAFAWPPNKSPRSQARLTPLPVCRFCDSNPPTLAPTVGTPVNS